MDRVELQLAVKTRSPEQCRAAALVLADLGQPVLLAHNRVQEAVATVDAIRQVPRARLALIGPLQSNKINQALRCVDSVDTVDRLDLVAKLDARAAPGAIRAIDARPLPVMVQVNVSGEATKSGCLPGQASAIVDAVAGSQNLRLAGLMTVGLNSMDEAPVRAAYADLRALRDSTAARLDVPERDLELSMGMSGDLEWAIMEGATIVRLGTAIFGAR